jgi:hypothetical protein
MFGEYVAFLNINWLNITFLHVFDKIFKYFKRNYFIVIYWILKGSDDGV